ncbi:hypothetical protein DE146DRAFT_661612 [Phaeosphaeria sp. MPI-PUGE-AT-0046c]|nr:hypothetical protein DE146DRAFT_661612 [Phaeosphaeria sp. MPI-PUGE-AT-0046c]
MSLKKLFSPSIPPPAFTPSSLLDLSIKVYVITAPPSPIHLSLLTTLYSLHATIYISSSSLSVYNNSAIHLQTACPTSKGTLKPFIYDAADLSSVRTAAQALLKDEWRVDVLFLDVSAAQSEREGKDLILSSFLLATLLLPRMHTTASHFCHPNPSIRIVWITKNDAPHAEGRLASPVSVYGLAKEFARRGYEQVDEAHTHTLPNSNPVGVQHVVVDMAIPESSTQRFLRTLIPGQTHPDREACTLLYAGLAPDVRNGDYIIPWGRKGLVPDSMASTMEEEGEMCHAESSFVWCGKHTQGYR